MLASILALPSAAVSGTANYLNNRRRGLAYTAGALGGAYVLGQWAVQRVLEGAEKGRKENGERDEYVPYSSLDPHASFSALRGASSLTPPPPTPPRRPPQPLSPVLAQPAGQPVHRPRPRPDHRLSASARARRRGAVQSAERPRAEGQGAAGGRGTAGAGGRSGRSGGAAGEGAQGGEGRASRRGAGAQRRRGGRGRRRRRPRGAVGQRLRRRVAFAPSCFDRQRCSFAKRRRPVARRTSSRAQLPLEHASSFDLPQPLGRTFSASLRLPTCRYYFAHHYLRRDGWLVERARKELGRDRQDVAAGARGAHRRARATRAGADRRGRRRRGQRRDRAVCRAAGERCARRRGERREPVGGARAGSTGRGADRTSSRPGEYARKEQGRALERDQATLCVCSLPHSHAVSSTAG